MSDVLIILVNYNSPADTYRCLESIAGSSVLPAVVVVDNCSVGDGLMDADKARLAYADTQVIFNPSNDGFGGGNNIGIEWGLRNTQADYFFILNNDTVVPPNTIAELIEHLESHPDTGMCSPAIFRLNEPDIYWFGGGYIDWSMGGARSPNINKKIGEEVAIAENTFITGCAMFTRRTVLANVGGFSPDYFMYSEDIDYCQRVLDAGYRVDFVANSRIFHDAHASVVKDRSVFISPTHWSNRNLPFVLRHVTYGTLLNLSKYPARIAKLKGYARVLVCYIRWCVSYLRHGRLDAISAIISGAISFLMKKRPA